MIALDSAERKLVATPLRHFPRDLEGSLRRRGRVSVRYMINSDNAAWRVVDGAATILRADTTCYYGLNKAGTFLWMLLLEEAIGVEEMATALELRYQLPAGRDREHVVAMVDLLSADQVLMELDDEVAGDLSQSVEELVTSVADGTGPTPPYEAPEAQKFGTLEQLIVSGE